MNGYDNHWGEDDVKFFAPKKRKWWQRVWSVILRNTQATYDYFLAYLFLFWIMVAWGISMYLLIGGNLD